MTDAKNVRSGKAPRDPNDRKKPNQAPIAVLSVLPAIAGEAVTVSTVGTTDGDGHIRSGSLNWGDGTIVTFQGDPASEYTHTYSVSATYTISLSVVDNKFASDAATASVTFEVPEEQPTEEEEPLPPIAQLSYVEGQYRGETYTLSTVGTVAQELATLAGGSLDWGDNSTDDTWVGNPADTYDHTYANAGTYTVTLTVTDSNGAIATASRQVIIESRVESNQAPLAKLSKISGNFVGDAYTFSTIGTTDPDGTIATWSFTPGDGQAAQTGTGTPPSTIQETYTAASTYTARLTVTDAGGLTHSASVNVTVAAAPAAGSFTYFDTLVARSDRVFAYSLRDATQVASLRAGSGTHISYIYSTDEDARKQDAAKVVVPATVNSISTGSQLYLPIPWPRSNGSIMFTWDSWMGAEFDYATSGIPTYKHFQHGSPDNSIWCEVRAHFNNPIEDNVLRIGGRVYLSSGSAIGPNVTDNEPLAPSSATIAVPAETWTRYWSLFEPDGDYDLYSLWVAVAGGTPTKKYDRLQLKMRADASGVRRLGIFRMEYNTSTWEIAPDRVPLVAYVRNFVGLRGITQSSITSLLEAP